MLKHGEINPLNVFDLRRLNHCPPHFSKVIIKHLYVDPKKVTDWIYENLSGRFCMIDYVDESDTGRSNQVDKCVAFEEAGEASMFTLMIDQINPQPKFL